MEPIAVILSGGQSRRMGRDKASLDFGGKPMLTRLVDPALRVAPQWELPGAATVSTLGDLVEPGAQIDSPASREEMDETVRHMLSQNSHQLTLRYPGISVVQARQVMEQAQSQAQAVLEEGHHQARQLQAQTRQWLEQVMGDYQVLRQGLGELFGSVRTLTVLAQRVEEMDKQMQSLQEKVMGHEQR